MPGFPHIAIALGLSYFLFKFTKGKFGVSHSIVFTINAWFGPDLAGMFFNYESTPYWFVHGYGWFAFAIPLAFIWALILNYKLSLKPFKLDKKDYEKESLITIPEMFCLVFAGGIFHQTMDLVGHPSTITYNGVENTPWGAVWFGGDNWFSMESIWGTGMFPCGGEITGFTLEAGLLIGIVGVITIFLVLKKLPGDKKKFGKIALIVNLIYLVPLIIAYFIPDYSGFDINGEGVNYFGDPNYVPSVYRFSMGEADLGVMLYFILFIFVPLMFLYFGSYDIPGLKKKGIRAEIEKIEIEIEQEKEKRIQDLMSSRNA